MREAARVARENFGWLGEIQFQTGAIVGFLVAKCDAVLHLAT